MPALGNSYADASSVRPVVTGASTITYPDSNRVARYTSPNTSSKASHYASLYLPRGAILKLTIRARAVAADSAGRFGVDIVTGRRRATVTNYVEITSRHWRVYTLSYAADLTGQGETVDVWWGVLTAQTGTIEAEVPQYEILDDAWGGPRVLAGGLIRINGGAGAGPATAVVETAWCRRGIVSITRTSQTAFALALDIPFSPVWSDGTASRMAGSQTLPLIFFTPSSNYGTTLIQLGVREWPGTGTETQPLTLEGTSSAGKVDWDALTGTYFSFFVAMGL